MKQEIYKFELPLVLKVFLIVVAIVLFLMATIFFFKKYSVAFMVFLILGIMSLMATSYKRVIFFEKITNKISICKIYLGIVVSKKIITLDSQSHLYLFVDKFVGRSSMGYTQVSGFLTLSVTGNGIKKRGGIKEYVLCSEHLEDKKPEFMQKVQEISTILGVFVTEK